MTDRGMMIIPFVRSTKSSRGHSIQTTTSPNAISSPSLCTVGEKRQKGSNTSRGNIIAKHERDTGDINVFTFKYCSFYEISFLIIIIIYYFKQSGGLCLVGLQSQASRTCQKKKHFAMVVFYIVQQHAEIIRSWSYYQLHFTEFRYTVRTYIRKIVASCV